MIGWSTHWEIRARRFRTSCLPKRCVQLKSNVCAVKVDAVWIVESLAFLLNMELVDFIKSDLVVMESIVNEVDVELECGGQ